MLKIKVFDEEHEKDLEKKLNDFLKECEDNNQEIVDIKFSTSHFADENQEQIYCFSALIMYGSQVIKEHKPKKYEIVEKVDD